MPQLSSNFDKAYLMTADEAVAALGVNKNTGLSTNEAIERQRNFNKKKSTSLFSFLLHGRQKINKALVRRDNKEIVISEKDLVRGDIVILKPGTIVPADARLLTANMLVVNNTLKHFHSFHERRSLINRHNMVYADDNVTSGNGLGVVTNISHNNKRTTVTKDLPEVDQDMISIFTEGVPKIERFDFVGGGKITANSTIGVREELALSALATTSANSENFLGQFRLSANALSRLWRYRDILVLDNEEHITGYLGDHPLQGNQTLFVTCTPEEVLHRSGYAIGSTDHYDQLSSTKRVEIIRYIKNLRQQGFSLLAVAIKRHMQSNELHEADFHNLVFLGVYVMTHVIKPDAKKILSSLTQENHPLTLMTKEHGLTAKYLATQLGLTLTPDAIADAATLHHSTDEEVLALIPHIRLWTQLTDLDKQRLQRLLTKTKQGRQVPSLKKYA